MRIYNLRPNSAYYCRVTDSNNTFSYLRVKTTVTSAKCGLGLKLSGTKRIFNGKEQQLIDSAKVTDLCVEGHDVDEDVYHFNVFKSNIYLKITDYNTVDGDVTYSTDWYNLNNLNKLVAINAGTYYVYYYINTDNDTLKYYDYHISGVASIIIS